MSDQMTPSPVAPKPEVKREKKPGLLRRFSKYLKDTRGEIKKVSWPSRQQIINNTIIVIVCIAVIGAFIGVMDFGLARGLQALLGLATGAGS